MEKEKKYKKQILFEILFAVVNLIIVGLLCYFGMYCNDNKKIHNESIKNNNIVNTSNIICYAPPPDGAVEPCTIYYNNDELITLEESPEDNDYILKYDGIYNATTKIYTFNSTIINNYVIGLKNDFNNIIYHCGDGFTWDINFITGYYLVTANMLSSSGASESELQAKYNEGYTAGVSSVDTENYYQNGYNAGVDSVDTDIYFENGYSVGYNDGQNSVDTQSYYDNGYKQGKIDGALSVDKQVLIDSGYANGYEKGKTDGINSVDVVGYYDGGYFNGYADGLKGSIKTTIHNATATDKEEIFKWLKTTLVVVSLFLIFISSYNLLKNKFGKRKR